MSKATSLGEAYVPYSPGPSLQYQVPVADHGVTGTIAAGGTLTGTLILTDGWPKVAVGLTSSQPGAVSVQRYLDDAGSVPQGAAVSTALVAGTAEIVNVTDGNPFASAQVKVTNTGASAATLSNVGILLSA